MNDTQTNAAAPYLDFATQLIRNSKTILTVYDPISGQASFDQTFKDLTDQLTLFAGEATHMTTDPTALAALLGTVHRAALQTQHGHPTYFTVEAALNAVSRLIQLNNHVMEYYPVLAALGGVQLPVVPSVE